MDSTVSNGTTYYYVVSSLDSAGESANSAPVSAKPTAPSTPPASPTNIVATAGDGQISLTWSASSSATSYHVKRATVSGGPYTQIAAPIPTSYNDTALVNGTAYYYVVSAINSAGESTASVEVSAIPSPPPPTTFGAWTDVTPSGVDLTHALCSNFGARTVQTDQAHPANLYTAFDCQGIWKSTDYGATWTGPINTGTNGTLVSDCSGGITIAPSSSAGVPTMYESCIRGSALGFWKSVDGGVNWNRYVVLSGAARQDYSPPVIDPYDSDHLLMTGHEFDSVVESVDGGLTWTSVSLNGGMLQSVLNSTVFFIKTGNASTTRATWLWVGGPSGGAFGTWRTVNRGASWIRVDKNETAGQIYQPDDNGVVFMAGVYSDLGWGVLRSADYGQTWTHVGGTSSETVVAGTSKNVYSMTGGALGPGGVLDPHFELAAQPGTGTWVMSATPAGLTQGAAQIAVTNDGTHNILVTASWNSGLWRYVEP